MMPKNISEDCLKRLLQKYGELLTLKELATVLRYPSVGAIRTTAHRGRLPVRLYQFSSKRGKFAKVEDVAACLQAMESDQDYKSTQEE